MNEPPTSEGQVPAPESRVVPTVEACELVKSYGHIQALRGADFTAYPGEVVALIGDNGAGKSTLVKCLSGAVRPDSGTILFNGRPVVLGDPLAARSLGIETVYQDLALAPDLDAAANLFLGRELRHRGLFGKLGVLRRREMATQATEIYSRLGVKIQRVDAPIGTMSGGQQQGIAVARAAAWSSKVIFMDEPTAALGAAQTHRVFELIDRIRSDGMTVVLISHNLPEVLQIADRIEVFRLGTRVAEIPAKEATTMRLVGLMTGAETVDRADA